MIECSSEQQSFIEDIKHTNQASASEYIPHTKLNTGLKSTNISSALFQL